MARIHRSPGYITQEVVGLGTASAVVPLTMVAPFIGAQVERLIINVQAAGAGTGTYDVALRGEANNTVLAKAFAVDGDAAVDTEAASVRGNNVGADEVDLELDVTENGTVSTEMTAAITVIWS